VLSQHFPRASGDTLTLAIRSSAGITSRAVEDRVTGALAPFERAPHVTSVSDPYQAPGHISADGHIAFATIQFDRPSVNIANSDAKSLISDARAASGRGVSFSLGGDLVDLAETPFLPRPAAARASGREGLVPNCLRPPSYVPVPDVPLLSPTRRARDGSVPPNWRYVAL
jgi:hypothetical protein